MFSATPDETCATSQMTMRGVWYQYTADSSGTLRLNTCRPGTDIATRISVFTGECDNLTCLHYEIGTFECGYLTDLTFNVAEGTTYYILLSGSASYEEQTYQMNIKCDTVIYDCPDKPERSGSKYMTCGE